MQRAYQIALLMLALAASGCSQDFSQPATYARGNDNEFTNFVMPVLWRDCGFQACHGSGERFFRIYGVGRTRLELGKTECMVGAPMPPCYYDALNGSERDFSLQSAQSFIDIDNPADSLLLRKPLAVEAGGADHAGVDKFGRNVYRTPDDEGFLILQRWVFNAQKRLVAGAATTTPTTPVTVQAGAPATQPLAGAPATPPAGP